MASVLPETRRGPERPGGRRARPPALAAARARREVRDRHDPKRIRYGCFLPDLTGLATAPPTPAPRSRYIRSPTSACKAEVTPCGRPTKSLTINNYRAHDLDAEAAPFSARKELMR